MGLDANIVNNLYKVLAEALTATSEKITEQINSIPEYEGKDEDAKFQYLDNIDKMREDG